MRNLLTQLLLLYANTVFCFGARAEYSLTLTLVIPGKRLKGNVLHEATNVGSPEECVVKCFVSDGPVFISSVFQKCIHQKAGNSPKDNILYIFTIII